MKLIKQTTLHFQEAGSDKVYEVDLCQVGEDLYLVNFRYGRRGTNLKEGTKTDKAVPLAQAQKVFDKLVAEKTKKGYRDVTSAGVSAAPAVTQTATVVEISVGDPRKQAIINRLAGGGNSKWPLERAIWRAGELKIREAAPLLIQLFRSGDRLRDYCIAWALGWCGDESSIPPLQRIVNGDRLPIEPKMPEFVCRIAWEAIVKLSDEETKATLRSEKIAQLPLELREIPQNGSAEAFSTALISYLNNSEPQRFSVLDTIYQIDNSSVRPALLNILSTAPLKPNYFKQIRHIFKMAEYRHDAEVFAILTRRFEEEPAMFRSDGNYIGLPEGGYLRKYEYHYNRKTRKHERVKLNEFFQEMESDNARIAYSNKTREYLQRRVWRTLKQLGEESDSDYIKMAVTLLLQYTDADAGEVKNSDFQVWNYSDMTRIHYNRDWDSYARYLTFNHILYENSPRYVLFPNNKAWRCQENYKPGDPEPEVREEAFPQLWQQNPEALLQLLLASNCQPVHHFAVKALKACQQFCANIDIDTIIKLLGKPYEVTAELSLNLVINGGYHRQPANKKLVLAVANCVSQNARTSAYRWIEEQREYFLEDSQFIAALVTSAQTDTRQFARRLLSSSIINDHTARVLIARIIAELLAFPGEPTELGEIAKEIAETLLISFTPQLRNLGLGIILDLLRHPLPEIQELGARILLNHEINAANLPPNLIESLLESPYEQVRVVGVRLFGQLPDETLIGSQSILIIAMAVNPVAEIRNAIRPVIRRLSREYPAFATQLVSEFIDVLMIPERHQGVHSYLVSLLREDIPEWMSSIDRNTALRLLKAKSSATQELGGFILGVHYPTWAAEFDIIDIVKLASHEILSVREAARKMFIANLDRIRRNSQEMLAAVRLLESKWDDSREFAHQTFKTEFSSEEWTPEVMVSICDSIREDVRQFGRDLVSRNFQAAYGQDYLLKFSEHPSGDMQLFATNYLESYAVDRPDRLRELMPYFITVLSRVNRGRVAKQIIFAFLDAEAQKSEAAATVVAEILTRQSATIAIGDKAAAIQTMLKIHKVYPQLNLPIQVKEVVEVRS